ncbi:MAG: cobalamin-binding protein [Burkholderiales bacterium]|nr:cobalamin-binding protein [Burkholderiales bacterium]
MTRFVALLLLVASGAAHGALRVIDGAGVEVVLARPAQRIVSLAPHATEMLFAAGAGSALVGAVAHSDWPPAARKVPRVGDAAALDLERIALLEPDLVIAWPYTASAQLAALRAQKVPVYTSDPKSIAAIADDVENLGTLAGTRGIALTAAGSMRERLAALRGKYRGAAKLRVFYQVWNEPLYTVGGRHLISEAIGVCGGENVFAALLIPAPSVTVEAVIAAAPDVIVGGDDHGARPAWLDDWRRWPQIPAVRDGNLIGANGDLLHRPGPRFVEGTAALCADLEAARRKRG